MHAQRRAPDTKQPRPVLVGAEALADRGHALTGEAERPGVLEVSPSELEGRKDALSLTTPSSRAQPRTITTRSTPRPWPSLPSLHEPLTRLARDSGTRYPARHEHPPHPWPSIPRRQTHHTTTPHHLVNPPTHLLALRRTNQHMARVRDRSRTPTRTRRNRHTHQPQTRTWPTISRAMQPTSRVQDGHRDTASVLG